MLSLPQLSQILTKHAPIGLICFIFSIHANQERRSFRELEQAFHQLCGRDVGLDELKLLKTVYPEGLTFSYKGLSSSKPLELDLMIQIPKEGGGNCFDKHKEQLHLRLRECARKHNNKLDAITLLDLPERPSNRSLEKSEKIVKRVMQSYSPVKDKVGVPGTSSSSKIKSFFQNSKIISSGALNMVSLLFLSHTRPRKHFSELSAFVEVPVTY